MVKYDLTTGISSNLPHMDNLRNGVSAVVFRDHVWAIGGYYGIDSSDLVDTFNLTSQRYRSAMYIDSMALQLLVGSLYTLSYL